MHEVAHWHVFRKRAHSDALGNWVLGPLVGSDFLAYRQRHWQHHHELGMQGDTKVTYRMRVTPRDLVHFATRCFSLGEALGKLRHTGAVTRAAGLGEADASAQREVPDWLLRTALVHGLLVSSLFAAALAFHGPSLETLLLSTVCAYGFAEHASHHRHPGIPADRLQALTDRLCVDEPRLQPCAGYLATWRMLLAQESREGLAGSRPG